MKTKTLIQIALGTAIIAAMSVLPSLPLPFSPVPITFQTFALFLVAVVLGKRSIASIALYLLMGAAGLPVFAEMKGGIGTMFGPTGGYLVGFLAIGFTLGYASDYIFRKVEGREKRPHVLDGILFAVYGLIGLAIVYAIGSLRLSAVLAVPLEQAIGLGVTPFIIPDLVKLLLAIVIGTVIRRRIPMS